MFDPHGNWNPATAPSPRAVCCRAAMSIPPHTDEKGNTKSGNKGLGEELPVVDTTMRKVGRWYSLVHFYTARGA